MKNFFLNINLPNRGLDSLKGIKFTSQGQRAYGHEILSKKDPRGNEYHWIGGTDLSYKSINGSDIDTLKSGYVSITPLKTDYTDYEFEEFDIKLKMIDKILHIMKGPKGVLTMCIVSFTESIFL